MRSLHRELASFLRLNLPCRAPLIRTLLLRYVPLSSLSSIFNSVEARGGGGGGGGEGGQDGRYSSSRRSSSKQGAPPSVVLSLSDDIPLTAEELAGIYDITGIIFDDTL